MTNTGKVKQCYEVYRRVADRGSLWPIWLKPWDLSKMYSSLEYVNQDIATLTDEGETLEDAPYKRYYSKSKGDGSVVMKFVRNGGSTKSLLHLKVKPVLRLESEIQAQSLSAADRRWDGKEDLGSFLWETSHPQEDDWEGSSE